MDKQTLEELVETKEKHTYDQIFVETFSISPEQLGDSIAYNQFLAWDSIGHMTLIAALESAFGITMDTDDILNFSSYKKGFEILSKYGVQVDKKAA